MLKHNRKCISCGVKLSQYHDEETCDDCWDAKDEPAQVPECAICGNEVFDNLEICDDCKRDSNNSEEE